MLDIEALKSAIIVGETKLLVMNFPHNPTGAVLTYPEQLEVVKLAKSFDIWIFSDEVYKGFELIDDADSEFFPSTKDFGLFCSSSANLVVCFLYLYLYR